METLDYHTPEPPHPPSPGRRAFEFWMTYLTSAVVGLIATRALEHYLGLSSDRSDDAFMCFGLAFIAFLAVLLAAVQGSRGPQGLPVWVALICGLLGVPLPLIVQVVADWASR